jgi:hypothetical protein
MHVLVILRFRATVRAAETDGVNTSLVSVADRDTNTWAGLGRFQTLIWQFHSMIIHSSFKESALVPRLVLAPKLRVDCVVIKEPRTFPLGISRRTFVSEG